jgi:hypothetical protein
VIHPSAHFVHALAPDAEILPESHLSQSIKKFQVIAGGEYFPAAQVTHGAEPAASLYVPAAHAPHAPPLGPV